MREEKFKKDFRGSRESRAPRDFNRSKPTNIRSWKKDDDKNKDDFKPKFEKKDPLKEEFDIKKEFESIKKLEELINEYNTMLKNYKGIVLTEWFKEKYKELPIETKEYLEDVEIYVLRMSTILNNKKEKFSKLLASSHESSMNLVSSVKERDKDQKPAYKKIVDEFKLEAMNK
ncbi:hypothetical protein [Mycoplasmopsis alligatoris]|uniref:hypothetical protein n=1 Tax=Mycoplasmopsis alligatoris TaxID=47687 RepID=UPI0002F747C4|nr:hypothetical protein [Mycoplasmopsis alligatoris]